MNSKVDPAALLVAVLAVGVNPLTEDGPWDLINTVVAVIVGIVVFGFTWPHGTVKEELVFDRWAGVAQVAVYGFVLAIALAWVVQSIWGLISGPCNPFMPYGCIPNSVAGWSSLIALGLGLGSGFFFYRWLRRATESLELLGNDGSASKAACAEESKWVATNTHGETQS